MSTRANICIYERKGQWKNYPSEVYFVKADGYPENIAELLKPGMTGEEILKIEGVEKVTEMDGCADYNYGVYPHKVRVAYYDWKNVPGYNRP